MRTILLLVAGGLGVGLGLATAACTAEGPPDPRVAQAGAEQLSRALAGYAQSGPPQSCVQLRDLRGNRSAGDAIVFDGQTSGTLYVNRPPGGCPSLDFGRALVTRTSVGALCRGDIADVFDPVARITYGGCGLGEFVPYKRVGR
ncbi:MAG: hypothetical protein JO013_01635 [Alphaproteobacteria bacterium]|nr:hypothetical protein [Alphaproteobacteria bacterium]